MRKLPKSGRDTPQAPCRKQERVFFRDPWPINCKEEGLRTNVSGFGGALRGAFRILIWIVYDFRGPKRGLWPIQGVQGSTGESKKAFGTDAMGAGMHQICTECAPRMHQRDINQVRFMKKLVKYTSWYHRHWVTSLIRILQYVVGVEKQNCWKYIGFNSISWRDSRRPNMKRE